ncbi:SLATT domain-containing protein [Myroides odoratimimus]|uniref:SLATT domain-containing protein n=1 Tax=Myroides odoratimimus TaxID=76832 RepID=UPI00257849DA|nr:SLATT domain-containing protein [Myroides odoratimimus]MDM1065424.1 SLATT domain-containing protein [Myroides odoratimimus]
MSKQDLKEILPAYLKNNDFGEELNYKLWITKGSRFNASQRNYTLNKLSSRSIGYLSAYLIIVGVINVYEISIFGHQFTDKQIGFITTAISVLILLFSQLESSENFLLKAERYHFCSLEISELYSKHRLCKHQKLNEEEEVKVLNEINTEYEVLLKKYDNHAPIDYEIFMCSKSEYFKIGKRQRLYINLKYYFQVRFVYHCLIYAPLLLIILAYIL